jgi:hypothetical protein
MSSDDRVAGGSYEAWVSLVWGGLDFETPAVRLRTYRKGKKVRRECALCLYLATFS